MPPASWTVVTPSSVRSCRVEAGRVPERPSTRTTGPAAADGGRTGRQRVGIPLAGRDPGGPRTGREALACQDGRRRVPVAATQPADRQAQCGDLGGDPRADGAGAAHDHDAVRGEATQLGGGRRGEPVGLGEQQAATAGHGRGPGGERVGVLHPRGEVDGGQARWISGGEGGPGGGDSGGVAVGSAETIRGAGGCGGLFCRPVCCSRGEPGGCGRCPVVGFDACGCLGSRGAEEGGHGTGQGRPGATGGTGRGHPTRVAPHPVGRKSGAPSTTERVSPLRPDVQATSSGL